VAHQGLAAAQGDVGAELLADGGLADPWLPDDHEERALAGEGSVEGRL
jgi:hypothetical protein